MAKPRREVAWNTLSKVGKGFGYGNGYHIERREARNSWKLSHEQPSNLFYHSNKCITIFVFSMQTKFTFA